MQKYEIVATTLMGLEDTLADEIYQLGGREIKELKRAVSFTGDDYILYKANMALRTALRLLVPIDSFYAVDEEELYQKALTFPWEKVFHSNQTFAIKSVVNGTRFTHSKYVALRLKDAIADRFREKSGIRPNVDTENPDVWIHIHANDKRVTISLDSAGISLDRRGYRLKHNEAPMNEVLAAGIILKTGWRPEQILLDPMSGSGTFGIEAALIGNRIPPNLNRKFSFQNWPDFNSELFQKAKSDLEDRITEKPLKIYCRDIVSENLEIIASNATLAGVDDHISLKKENFFDSEPPKDSKPGIIVLNPPYGERLTPNNLKKFYENIGKTLKQKYEGYEVWIICSDDNAMRVIGLSPSTKRYMMNGGIEAKLQKYELYRGSKRK